ncbi:MAG: hypothetical protein EZS28_053197, partial [Streblomastix strix]
MPKKSDYRIVRALGHGAFGSTFLIIEISTGKELVWKKMTIVTDEDRRLSRMEADNMQRTKSEYLVQFI